MIVRKFEMRSLGRPRCRWEDNIKMGLKEIGHKDVAWIHVISPKVSDKGCH
jgi:hypothetical protein